MEIRAFGITAMCTGRRTLAFTLHQASWQQPGVHCLSFRLLGAAPSSAGQPSRSSLLTADSLSARYSRTQTCPATPGGRDCHPGVFGSLLVCLHAASCRDPGRICLHATGGITRLKIRCGTPVRSRIIRCFVVARTGSAPRHVLLVAHRRACRRCARIARLPAGTVQPVIKFLDRLCLLGRRCQTGALPFRPPSSVGGADAQISNAVPAPGCTGISRRGHKVRCTCRILPQEVELTSDHCGRSSLMPVDVYSLRPCSGMTIDQDFQIPADAGITPGHTRMTAGIFGIQKAARQLAELRAIRRGAQVPAGQLIQQGLPVSGRSAQHPQRSEYRPTVICDRHPFHNGPWKGIGSTSQCRCTQPSRFVHLYRGPNTRLAATPTGPGRYVSKGWRC